MHLRQVTLNNFRCFDHLTVDLHPRLTVLVAENGGGKTSVLDGIAIGLTPILKALSSANQRLGGPEIEDTDFRILTNQKDQEYKAEYAQIILETTDGKIWDEWKASAPGYKPEETHGKSKISELSDFHRKYAEGQAADLPVFAYYGTQRGMLKVPKRMREKLSKPVDRNYPTSGLFRALDPKLDFREILNWFDQEEASELRFEKEMGVSGLSTVLNVVRAALRQILGYRDPHFDSRGKFCVRIRSAPYKLQVTQLSQGYQSMLALAMDFARRLAICSLHFDLSSFYENEMEAFKFYRKYHSFEGDDIAFAQFVESPPNSIPSVMLVDEIDLHLHPSWQQRVLEDLMKAFPHTQFIVTTHSPQVLTTVKSENIRMLSKDSEGIWSANIPAQEIKGAESAMALIDIMGVDPIPQVEEAGWVTRYSDLIETNQHDTEEGKQLHEKLKALYGSDHPIMLDLDRLRRLQAFKLKRSNSSKD
jgi:predicted ATP-binding protein involved in virulence